MFASDGYLDRLVKVDDAARHEDPDTIGIDDLIGFGRRRRETRPNSTAGHTQLNSDLAAIDSRELE